jgi:hypothetical protein
MRVLTDQQVIVLYQCPCSRETRHLVLSLPSFFGPRRCTRRPPPSVQYQEPRNSDLFFAIPITTHIGMMPSIARLANPSFISCLFGLLPVQDSHEKGAEEVVEHGARLGVLLVFPSQLFTSYRLKPLVSTKCPARYLPCLQLLFDGLMAATYYPPRFPQWR